jgi:hypothetical protein
VRGERTDGPGPRLSGWTRALVAAAGLALSPACAPSEAPPDPALAFLLDRHDSDGDGRITRAEYGRDEAAFGRLDRDRSGVVDAADLADLRVARAQQRARNGGGSAPSGRSKSEVRGASDQRPLMGLPAPDLLLPRLEGGAPEQLSALWTDRPVLLVFGSWT